MDVDPKPTDGEQASNPMMGSGDMTSPQEPMSPDEPQSSMEGMHPTGAPSPVIAAALDQEVAEDKEPQTEPPMVSNPTPAGKKSHKGLIITLVIVVLLVIAALAWYVFYGLPTPKSTASDTTKATTQSTVSPATSATNAATVDTAVNSLTSNATDETTLTETDDSSNATDASTSAANVGDSVNENNF